MAAYDVLVTFQRTEARHIVVEAATLTEAKQAAVRQVDGAILDVVGVRREND